MNTKPYSTTRHTSNRYTSNRLHGVSILHEQSLEELDISILETKQLIRELTNTLRTLIKLDDLN